MMLWWCDKAFNLSGSIDPPPWRLPKKIVMHFPTENTELQNEVMTKTTPVQRLNCGLRKSNRNLVVPRQERIIQRASRLHILVFLLSSLSSSYHITKSFWIINNKLSFPKITLENYIALNMFLSRRRQEEKIAHTLRRTLFSEEMLKT